MADPVPPRAKTRPRILFVDDEVTLREHLVHELSDEFDVEPAGNGSQALKAILRARPDIIVTDVMMPEIGGIELLKTLRSTPSTQSIPVLLVSAYAAEEIRIEGFEEGADGYLAKPYTVRELRTRIRTMLQISQQRMEVVRREARKAAEQKATAERAALLESITDPFYALDRRWRYTYANQLAIDHFGKSREELIGKNIWELFPEGKFTVFQAQYERAMRSGVSVSFEALSPIAGRWIEVHAYPTPSGLAVHFRDISDRKRAESALRQAEERYRAFVANSTEGVWRYELGVPLDVSLPIEEQIDHVYAHAFLAEANDAMARMYGYEHAQELLGARLAQTLPRADEAALAYVRTLVEAGFAISDVESAERDRQGHMRYFSNSMVPVIEGGKLVRAWGTRRDITERKLSEEALRQANQMLGTLVHSCPVAVVVVDPEPPVVRLWNPAAEVLFGWKESEVIGRTNPTVPEEEVAEAQSYRADVVGGRSFSNFETFRLRKDGSRIDVSVSAAPLRDARQHVNGVLLTFADITSRKRAEERLRVNEQWLRVVLDSVPLKIFTARPDGEVDYFNPQWTEFTGLTVDRMKGWGWTQFVHPEDVEQSVNNWREALEGAVAFQSEHRFRRADGEYRWHIGRAVPIRDTHGNVEMWIGANTEIHGVKRAEELALWRSEQIRGLAEVAQRLTAAADVSSALTLVTEEARILIGAHQAVTCFAIDQNWTDAVQAVSFSRKYGTRLPDEAPDRSALYPLVSSANIPVRMTQDELEADPAWTRLNGAGLRPPMRGWLAAPLVARDGRNLGLIQLSDREDGEFTEDDEAVLVQLAQMASVAIENARLVDNLRETDRRKDEFLAILAHELRNPLAPIRNGLQILRLRASADAAVQKTLSMMDRQMTHLVRLVDDLLDVGRITRGKLELRLEDLSLSEVLASAVESSRALLEARRHSLTVEMRAADLAVRGDSNRLAQVFSNLLSNSAKYTDAGGTVAVTVDRESNEAVVRVIDNGIGIPPEALDHVFDLFSQVRAHQSHTDGGLGIGLALVRRLVEMHDGSVSAFSEGPGKGSTFSVRLPLVSPAARVATERDEQTNVQTAARETNRLRRVLVVDDNADAAASLAGMLTMKGYDVHTAEDGIDAVEKTVAFEPEVIFMDLGMPRMDGIEATRRIRALPRGATILVVALTGWGQEADRQRTKAAGIDHHLVKPASSEALAEILALSGRAAAGNTIEHA